MNWINSVIILEFDIDEGQTVQDICPKNILTEKEKKNLAMMAFPDSNNYSN